MIGGGLLGCIIVFACWVCVWGIGRVIGIVSCLVVVGIWF